MLKTITACNRLTASSLGSDTTGMETYTYDSTGNIIQGMNHLYNAGQSLFYIIMRRTSWKEILYVDRESFYHQYDSGGQCVRKVIENTAAHLKRTIGRWAK